MKYNVHTKEKDRVINLALEAETAISCLADSDRDCYSWQVAKRCTIKTNNFVIINISQKWKYVRQLK